MNNISLNFFQKIIKIKHKNWKINSSQWINKMPECKAEDGRTSTTTQGRSVSKEGKGKEVWLKINNCGRAQSPAD